MARIDIDLALVAVMLEEFVTRLGMTYAAQHAQLGEVQIADRRAGIGPFGILVNVA